MRIDYFLSTLSRFLGDINRPLFIAFRTWDTAAVYRGRRAKRMLFSAEVDEIDKPVGEDRGAREFFCDQLGPRLRTRGPRTRARWIPHRYANRIDRGRDDPRRYFGDLPT